MSEEKSKKVFKDLLSAVKFSKTSVIVRDSIKGTGDKIRKISKPDEVVEKKSFAEIITRAKLEAKTAIVNLDKLKTDDNSDKIKELKAQLEQSIDSLSATKGKEYSEKLEVLSKILKQAKDEVLNLKKIQLNVKIDQKIKLIKAEEEKEKQEQERKSKNKEEVKDNAKDIVANYIKFTTKPLDVLSFDDNEFNNLLNLNNALQPPTRLLVVESFLSELNTLKDKTQVNNVLKSFGNILRQQNIDIANKG